MKTSGIVICRPQGGLNDMFCQIYKCLRYAVRHKRLLYVDTETNPKFLESLGVYFNSLNANLRFVDHVGANEILRNSRGGLAPNSPWNYEAVWDTNSFCFVEKTSRVKLTFDFKRKHDAEVLLHHQAGGGLNSGRLLLMLELTPHLKSLLAKRLEMFPRDYSAVHVRHSDYESDFKKYLPKTISKKCKVLFLSTDNDKVVEWAISNMPTVHTLKYKKSNNRNIEAICDLFMLANARNLIPVPLLNQGVAFSGYSRLASLMWTSLSPSLIVPGLPQFALTLRAIGGVRNPIITLLRVIAFSPLLIRSRFSKIGVVADFKRIIKRLGLRE